MHAMRFSLAAFIVALTVGPLAAAEIADAWKAQLQLDGYEEIEVSRTWLGRIRIVAEKGEIRREIVLNRTTGEVLRDYTINEDGSPGFPLGWAIEALETQDDESGDGDVEDNP